MTSGSFRPELTVGVWRVGFPWGKLSRGMKFEYEGSNPGMSQEIFTADLNKAVSDVVAGSASGAEALSLAVLRSSP